MSASIHWCSEHSLLAGGLVKRAVYGACGGPGAATVTTSFGYDPASRLTTINHTANGSPRASYSLTWDNANQLTREVSNDGTVNFSYDAIGQLIAVSGWRPETYS
ncbi:MAG: hypothetical protein ACUVUC_02945 [Thermoguttaceae bacterium]